MKAMSIAGWLITILFLLLPLGQLQELPLGISGVSIYVHDLVLAVMWLWILVKMIRHPEPVAAGEGSPGGFFARAQNDRWVKRFFVFTVIGLLSWLINYFHWGKASFIGLGYLVRWFLLSAPMFLFVILNPQKRVKDPKGDSSSQSGVGIRMTQLLKKSIFLLTLFGWLQYLIFPDLTRMDYFGWDDHFYRLTGTLLDPNFFGALMVIGLGLELCHPEPGITGEGSPGGFFARAQNDAASFFKKTFYLITLGLTYSRSSYIAWLVLLFGWGINKIFAPIHLQGDPSATRRGREVNKHLGGGLVKILTLPLRIFVRSLTAYSVYFWLTVSAIIFILLPRPAGEGGNLARTASIVGRLDNINQSQEIIRKYPIVGVGFNNYRLAVKEAGFPVENIDTNHAAGGADNSFLFVWATTGILGLIAFIWLISSLRPWWLILPIVIHSLFNHSLFYPWVLLYIWAIRAESMSAEV